MLYGIGCDLCSLSHLEKSLSSAHAAAFVRRVYGPAEQAALGLLEASPAPLNAHRLASAAARPVQNSTLRFEMTAVRHL